MNNPFWGPLPPRKQKVYTRRHPSWFYPLWLISILLTFWLFFGQPDSPQTIYYQILPAYNQ